MFYIFFILSCAKFEALILSLMKGFLVRFDNPGFGRTPEVYPLVILSFGPVN